MARVKIKHMHFRNLFELIEGVVGCSRFLGPMFFTATYESQPVKRSIGYFLVCQPPM